MAAGRYRHRVTLQRCTEAQSATTGEVTKTWHDVVSVWAAVEPLSGREYFSAQQAQAETTHKVSMRHNSHLTTALHPKDRILFGTRTLGIENVLNLEERNIEVVCMCREEVA